MPKLIDTIEGHRVEEHRRCRGGCLGGAPRDRRDPGECGGGEGDGATGFNHGWDTELAMKVYPTWVSRGYMPGRLMPVEDLVEVVHTILHAHAATSIPVVVVRGAPGSPAVFADSAQ